MPLIAIKLDQALYSEVLSLVSEGDYRDLQQLVEVALRNHLQLEQQYPKSGGRVNPTREHPIIAARRSRSHAPQAKQSVANVTTDGGNKFARDGSAFRLPIENSNRLQPCAAVARPADEHLYALVNRLFPLKLVARWLDTHAQTLGRWPMALDVLRPLGSDIEALGSDLAKRDAEANRRRDEQLATSLPRKENPKSRERFITQFVARTNDAAEIFPAGIVQFALAAIKNGQLVLTDAGQELSRLANAIIDADKNDVSESLSDDERQFFLAQICNYMPAEAAHLGAVLQAVADGAKSPELLVAEFRGRFANCGTDAALRSHLSGVIARAIDLKVLQREWQGRYAFYSVTDAGAGAIPQLIKTNPDGTQPAASNA